MTSHFSLRRALLALSLVAASAAWAQPAKTTRILVAFPPGGPVDFVARTLADALGKELGQTVVVDNKAGGNGAVAAEQLIRSPADGTTLWLTSVGAVAINPALYDKLPYDPPRDLAPVSLVVNNVEGGRTPILPPKQLQEMGFSMAIYPSLGFLAAGHALREAYQNLQDRAAFRTPTTTPALHDFQAFSLMMGFQQVWDFDRRQAELDEASTSSRADSRRP